MKKCSKCGVLKPLTEFYAERKAADNRRSSCKKCDYEKRLNYLTGLTPIQMQNQKELRKKHRKTEAEYSKKYREKHRVQDLIRHAKKRAELRNLPFDLDKYLPELSERLAKEVCELSGVKLEIKVGNGRGPMNPSLDRIVPAKGYTLENIRIVAYALNTAMGDWGIEPILEIARALVKKEN